MALLFWSASQQSNWYESNAADRSRHYARDAERQITESCSALAVFDKRECVEKAVQAARENQREEQDLAAQKVTAWWTRIMGGAAITGMVLSALGVYLVWTTFLETRRTANAALEANRIARENAAPIIDIEAGALLTWDDSSTDSRAQYVWAHIANIGLGWAKQMSVDCEFAIEGVVGRMPLSAVRGAAVKNYPPNTPSTGHEPFEFRGGGLRLTLQEIEACAGKRAVAFFNLRYIDPTGKPVSESREYSGNFEQVFTPNRSGGIRAGVELKWSH